MASEDRTEESVSSDGGEERKPSEVQLLVDLVSRQMEASRQREDRVIQRLERIDLPSVQRSAARDAGEGGMASPGPALGAPLLPAPAPRWVRLCRRPRDRSRLPPRVT